MKNRISQAEPSSDYRNAFIEVYRDELRSRYSPENIKKFEKLRGIHDSQILLLRDFFLNHLYPEPSQRIERDVAFESLGSVLVSPKKMMPLMGNAVGSVFKFGFQLPAALKAGWRTMEIYIRSHKMENELLQIAREKKVLMQDIKTRNGLRLAIKTMPAKKIIRFRSDILHLFESISNVKLLETTLTMMQHSRVIMSNYAKLYTDKELRGLDLGLSMLQSGLQLFGSFSNSQIETIIKGIHTIEKNWYEDLIK